MSKIKRAINLFGEYNNLDYKEIEKMVESMEEYAYENALIGDLIPLKNLNPYTIDISELEYEILTGSYNYEDYYFETLDDIEDFLQEKKRSLKIKYSEIVAIAYDEKNDNFSVFDTITKEEFVGDLKDYEEAMVIRAEIIREKIFDQMAEKYPKIEDFEYYQDEVIFNFAWKFGDFEIDIPNAIKSGLAVIEINSEKYLAFTSCGMDLSFQLFKYMILTFGAIDETFIPRLGGIKDSMGIRPFMNYLKKVGIKTEKINMDKFNRRF